ncbi:putative phage integrase [Carnobacterium sp. 17-4]|uniref:site-specific integrase n=1 Tax=Carnobacterium sp. (strain 17-4) TaxID=208596 RepID=UPI0002058CD8|nr:site-specific integrase [Carnobacterium sp. 17-4]AEB29578.1 putative phage integrase [Carnobacterium sp. 17-4]
MTTINKYKTKDGKTAYKFNAYLGTDSMTGKKKRTTRQGFKTKKEATLALSRLKLDIEMNGFKKSSTSKFKDVYELWIVQYKNTVKESTLNKTLELFNNHILPIFGDLYMDKITVVFCQAALNDWYKRLQKYKAISNYASRIFDYAITISAVEINPFKKVSMPIRKVDVEEEKVLNFYNKEELTLFFDHLKRENKPLQLALFRTLAFTGARKGEILALQWRDINFTDNTIKINKTVTFGLDNVLIIQTPKTKTSVRSISMDPQTMKILKSWKKTQKETYFKLGFNTLNPTQLVFPSTKNTVMQPPKVGKYLDRLVNLYELKRITPHGFRHTHCSLLFEAGASVKEVQDRLGHSNIQTTMNIYAHVTEKAKENTADKFAKYVNF